MPHFIQSSRSKPSSLRTLDVRADDTDARDYIFHPSIQTLLPPAVDRRGRTPILDQEDEGACVGFALAAVINMSLDCLYQKASRKRGGRKPDPVSPRMLYEMGRLYDEWTGENYAGTSLRGAMKGWHRHGVTTEKLWPYRVRRGGRRVADREFTPERSLDAVRRPIGAYYRIVDSDVSHVQAAVIEGDAVLASAWIHSGWQVENLRTHKNKNLNIKRIRPQNRSIGLHAFAVIGYTPEGFIIQNSWGRGWGSGGYALLGYDDWFENRQDAWVARPGPETRDSSGEPKIFTVGFAGGPDETRAETAASGMNLDPRLLPYLINTGDRGELSAGGRLTTRKEELPGMARRVLTTPALSDGYRHVVLYAHGGLNSETAAAATANRLWSFCGKRNLTAYFFIWESGVTESVMGWLKSDDDASGPARYSLKDAWESIKKGAGEIVRDAQKTLGKKLAPVVREVFWQEMEGRAGGASAPAGGAALFSRQLFDVMAQAPGDKYKIHLVGHSAGSIYLGWLYQKVLRNLLQTKSNRVALGSIQFMAPAITIDRAREAFSVNGTWAVPKERFINYMLKPEDEENDGIKIYPSSLLTYVADFLEDKNKRIPLFGIRSDFAAAAVNFSTPITANMSVKHGEFDEPGHEADQILDGISKMKF
jgi:hypothetical protein